MAIETTNPTTTVTDINDDVIDAGAVAADAIGAAEIAANAIGAAEIATAAIDADAIATDAITATEIAANAIGASELATDAIGAAEIADGAIDAGAIAGDAITAAKIAANAIGASELAIDAVEEINLSGMAIQSYPDTAAPATVSTGTVAFTYGGAWVQLIAASAIANNFYLSHLVINPTDINHSACFELATGGAGAESAILEVAITRSNSVPIFIPLEKKKIAANARVAIRACSEEAAINDYKVYLVVQK